MWPRIFSAAFAAIVPGGVVKLHPGHERHRTMFLTVMLRPAIRPR